MSNDEDTFRRLVVESRYLEQSFNQIQSRLNVINSALAELNVSKMTLEGLEKEKKGSQLFVPIGGGSYVKAKLETKKSIVVGIAADVAVEKSLHDAKVELELRISELEKTGETLNQQFNQVVTKIQENRKKIEEISSKLRKGEQPDVRQAKKGT